MNKDNFSPALYFISCSEITPQKLPKFAREDSIYLALMEGEGDNVATSEDSVIFLNIIKEFCFTFVCFSLWRDRTCLF